MQLLVTNDDGILSEGLWALVRELKSAARPLVVVPAMEQSSIGTAVTLRQVLRVQRVEPRVPEVETYTVDGTPSDSVILALGKLVRGRVAMVISGINLGLNLGEDVHISGTVAAALQGHLAGFPALAVSAAYENPRSLALAAMVAAWLAPEIAAAALPGIFLNVNVPDLASTDRVKGVRVTRLARKSHLNTVDEGDDGRRKYYWLVRQETNDTEKALSLKTDIGAVRQGYISLTPLYTNWAQRPPLRFLEELCAKTLAKLKTAGLA